MKPKRTFYALFLLLIGLLPFHTFAQDAPANLVGFIATDSAINVRDRPNGTFLFSLPPNMSVALLDQNADGSWLSVELTDGRTGWVSASLVRVMESAIPADLVPITPQNVAQLEKITQLASILATGLAFSPDGRLLVTYSWERGINVYDVRTKILITTLDKRTDVNVISDAEFSPDGRWLATASWDATVNLWNTENWADQMTFKGHSSEVIGIAFSPDSKLLATTGDDGLVNVWDIESGERVHMIEAYLRNGRSVAFSPDGRTLAAGGGNRLKLWNVETGEALWDEAVIDVSYVTFTPDGERVVTLSSGSAMTVMGYETETASFDFVLRHASGAATSLSLNPSGELISVSAWGGRFFIADVNTRDVLLSDTLKEPDAVDTVSAVFAFSPDGRVVASSDTVQDVHIWGVRGGD